jgi:hypothetical protein
VTSQQAVSGTESDSDSILSPENTTLTPTTSTSGGAIYTSNIIQPPLDSIAEGPLASEDSDDDREAVEDVDEGKAAQKRKSSDETIIKSGYLWKKGERRKVRSDLTLQAFLCGSLTRLYLAYISGLEETLVRPEICPPGLLQELGRIPTASALGPRRHPHMHTSHSQEARQRVVHRFTQADVLPPGGLSEGSPGMGQGR